MIRISDQFSGLCLSAGVALCSILLWVVWALHNPLFAADPPPLTSSMRASSAPEEGVNAQERCAAPVVEFQQEVNRAKQQDVLAVQHQRRFLQQLDSCRSVYQLELERLRADFAKLPSSSVCQAAQRELPEALEVFDAMAERARALQFDTRENRQAAAAFFSLTGPGLVRAVNGLYLLRYGVCMEEIYAPFTTPLTDPDITRVPSGL